MRHLFIIILLLGTLLPPAYGEEQQPDSPGWHQLSSAEPFAIHSHQALAWLKKHYKKPKPVIVGVVDTGVDTLLQDLHQALILNHRELPDGIDNDGDGYVDNRYGWNFLGDSSRKLELLSVGTEEFREFKRLYPRYKDVHKAPQGQEDEYAHYQKMKQKAGIDKYLRLYDYQRQRDSAYRIVDTWVKRQVGEKYQHLQLSELGQLSEPDTKDLEWASEMIYPDIVRNDSTLLWSKLLQRHSANLERIRSRIEGIEHDIDKRTLLGDNMLDGADRHYGNGDISGKGLEHGTFVASIIAGNGASDKRVGGIYPAARLLPVRAVPDQGDEYDKDIASAIYYCTDHGARVINLSLGKQTSPSAQLVREAMSYAAQHDVLLVQAAGNSGLLLDTTSYYPDGLGSDGKPLENYLRVGASDRQGHRASLSNYGKSVDLYAPGVDIWGVMEQGSVTSQQGTSLSAPIVSAVAAMIRSYFPDLTAPQVKDILLQSVHQGEVPILDAYQAALRASKAQRTHTSKARIKR